MYDRRSEEVKLYTKNIISFCKSNNYSYMFTDCFCGVMRVLCNRDCLATKLLHNSLVALKRVISGCCCVRDVAVVSRAAG
jgi:hypothetical protein